MVTNGAESFLTTTTSDTDAWEWDNDIGLANATEELEVAVSMDDSLDIPLMIGHIVPPL